MVDSESSGPFGTTELPEDEERSCLKCHLYIEFHHN